ncbi:hypothetical protein AB0H86_29815 [Streptomyces sp. NPDC050997]
MNWSRSAGDGGASTDAEPGAATAPVTDTVLWLPMDPTSDSR